MRALFRDSEFRKLAKYGVRRGSFGRHLSWLVLLSFAKVAGTQQWTFFNRCMAAFGAIHDCFPCGMES